MYLVLLGVFGLWAAQQRVKLGKTRYVASPSLKRADTDGRVAAQKRKRKKKNESEGNQPKTRGKKEARAQRRASAPTHTHTHTLTHTHTTSTTTTTKNKRGTSKQSRKTTSISIHFGTDTRRPTQKNTSFKPTTSKESPVKPSKTQ